MEKVKMGARLSDVLNVLAGFREFSGDLCRSVLLVGGLETQRIDLGREPRRLRPA